MGIDPKPLIRHFDAIGARLVVERFRQSRVRRTTQFDLDIRTDKRGEYFRLSVGPEAPQFRVLQANRAAKHLLFHAAGDDGGERFLCGHDERHWFVAALAGRPGTITDARRSLLPTALLDAGLTPDVLARRHNEVFLRQGEWFFVPSRKDLSRAPILHQEPLIRGRGSKPHIVSEVVRFGGTPVVLERGTEYSLDAWAAIVKDDPTRDRFGRRMMKDPEVYARGSVRHPDHATLKLTTWHRVYPNREARSVNVSFYD